MKLILLLLALCAPLWAADVIIGWTANAPSDHVTGYRVHYGTVTKTYTTVLDAGNAVRHKITNLTPGTTYFVTVTAYTAEGLESNYGDELTVAIPVKPAPPAGIYVVEIQVSNNLGEWRSLAFVPVTDMPVFVRAAARTLLPTDQPVAIPSDNMGGLPQ